MANDLALIGGSDYGIEVAELIRTLAQRFNDAADRSHAGGLWHGVVVDIIDVYLDHEADWQDFLAYAGVERRTKHKVSNPFQPLLRHLIQVSRPDELDTSFNSYARTAATKLGRVLDHWRTDVRPLHPDQEWRASNSAPVFDWLQTEEGPFEIYKRLPKTGTGRPIAATKAGLTITIEGDNFDAIAFEVDPDTTFTEVKRQFGEELDRLRKAFIV